MPRFSRLYIVSALALLFAFPAFAQTVDKPKKISPKELTERLGRIDGEIFYGGLMIEPGQHVDGPVIVVDGSLDIQDGGVLDGDAWVVNGRLVLTGAAHVTGHIELVNSDEFASRRARVDGGRTFYRSDCAIDADEYQDNGRLVFIKHRDPMSLAPRFTGAVGKPTRVRYDVLRLGMKRENSAHIPDTYFRWRAMVDLPMYFDQPHGYAAFTVDGRVPLRGRSLGLNFAGYKTLHSEDFWQVSRNENSLFLVTAASEYADFYEKRGGSLGLEWRPDPFFTVELSGLFQEEVSLPKHRVFSIGGNKDRLPENPDILDGNRAAGRVSLTYDSRDEPYDPRSAWRLFVNVETSRLEPDAVKIDDTIVTTMWVGAYRYNKLPYGLQWDIGGRVFTAFDPIPSQLTQSLGGYGGIRGTWDAPWATRRGDRVVLASTELRVNMPEIPVIRWFFSRTELMAFADAGYLTVAEDPTDPTKFLSTSFDNWKKTVGAGISGESVLPYVGLYVAKEVGENAREDTRLILRFERSF